jgi:hypothetical protein
MACASRHNASLWRIHASRSAVDGDRLVLSTLILTHDATGRA